jgi:hypothetical protein
MSLYDFRLRFNFSGAYHINSEADKIELLDLSPEEHITLVSGSSGAPISKQNKVAVIGKSFTSKGQARVAAEKCKRALLYWAIEQRLGLDFGGKQRSWFTDAGLARFEEKLGCPVRQDLHGIDVYEHVEKLKFVSFNAKAKLGKNPNKLVDTFKREYLNNRLFTEKQLLAGEIYTSSFFDVSARSRFITLVTAVEALLEQPKRSDDVETLVEEFKDKTRQSMVDETTKASIIGGLERLKNQSIGQAGRELSNQLLPKELFDGQASADFFSRCYGLRSQVLHDGTILAEGEDIWHLANVMEEFVNRLLLAALKSDSQQGAVADDSDHD